MPTSRRSRRSGAACRRAASRAAMPSASASPADLTGAAASRRPVRRLQPLHPTAFLVDQHRQRRATAHGRSAARRAPAPGPGSAQLRWNRMKPCGRQGAAAAPLGIVKRRPGDSRRPRARPARHHGAVLEQGPTTKHGSPARRLERLGTGGAGAVGERAGLEAEHAVDRVSVRSNVLRQRSAPSTAGARRKQPLPGTAAVLVTNRQPAAAIAPSVEPRDRLRCGRGGGWRRCRRLGPDAAVSLEPRHGRPRWCKVPVRWLRTTAAGGGPARGRLGDVAVAAGAVGGSASAGGAARVFVGDRSLAAIWRLPRAAAGRGSIGGFQVARARWRLGPPWPRPALSEPPEAVVDQPVGRYDSGDGHGPAQPGALRSASPLDRRAARRRGRSARPERAPAGGLGAQHADDRWSRRSAA